MMKSCLVHQRVFLRAPDKDSVAQQPQFKVDQKLFFAAINYLLFLFSFVVVGVGCLWQWYKTCSLWHFQNWISRLSPWLECYKNVLLSLDDVYWAVISSAIWLEGSIEPKMNRYLIYNKIYMLSSIVLTGVISLLLSVQHWSSGAAFKQELRTQAKLLSLLFCSLHSRSLCSATLWLFLPAPCSLPVLSLSLCSLSPCFCGTDLFRGAGLGRPGLGCLFSPWLCSPAVRPYVLRTVPYCAGSIVGTVLYLLQYYV